MFQPLHEIKVMISIFSRCSNAFLFHIPIGFRSTLRPHDESFPFYFFDYGKWKPWTQISIVANELPSLFRSENTCWQQTVDLISRLQPNLSLFAAFADNTVSRELLQMIAPRSRIRRERRHQRVPRAVSKKSLY